VSLWLLGTVTANSLGGFVHILLILAVAVVLVRVILGEQVFNLKLKRIRKKL
jgi:hypothetical protein